MILEQKHGKRSVKFLIQSILPEERLKKVIKTLEVFFNREFDQVFAGKAEICPIQVRVNSLGERFEESQLSWDHISLGDGGPLREDISFRGYISRSVFVDGREKSLYSGIITIAEDFPFPGQEKMDILPKRRTSVYRDW